jgi:hypothetical protein
VNSIAGAGEVLSDICAGSIDERVGRSPVGGGWIERTHFANACASLWIDGELVHFGWPLSPDGLRTLRGDGSAAGVPAPSLGGDGEGGGENGGALVHADETGGGERDDGDAGAILPDVDYAAIDAVLARSEAAINQAKTPGPAWARERIRYSTISIGTRTSASGHGAACSPRSLICCRFCRRTSHWMAGTRLPVLQHAPWLGRLLAA